MLFMLCPSAQHKEVPYSTNFYVFIFNAELQCSGFTLLISRKQHIHPPTFHMFGNGQKQGGLVTMCFKTRILKAGVRRSKCGAFLLHHMGN